jgi:hypothetical protein
MFLEEGFKSDCFDIFYNFDTSLLLSNANNNKSGRYDVITLTEVIEHLANPWVELDKLWHLIKYNGVMGIMTKLVLNLASFKNWHYKNDPTHIAFYSLDTLDYLSDRLGAEIEIVAKDAFIFKKTC